MSSGVLKTVIISLAIIIAAYILGKAYKNRNEADDTISVVGLGTKEFVSDQILFSGRYDAFGSDAKTAYDKILHDKSIVKQFFNNKGFKDNEFTFSGVNLVRDYKTVTTELSNGETRSEQVFNGYIASQSVSFESKKDSAQMKKIEVVSDETSELVNDGIEFEPDRLQYTYSDLPSLKHNLIDSATTDAYQRAKIIVKSGKGKLGKLEDASMGVFQITGQGDDQEDSYGGINDIYSKNKIARITVRLAYQLK